MTIEQRAGCGPLRLCPAWVPGKLRRRPQTPPAAALRRPTADGIIGHDCNPCIVPVAADTPTALRALPQGIQPASVLIVTNRTAGPVTVSGIPCYPGDTVLMYTGGADRYVRLGGPAPWVNPTEAEPKAEPAAAVESPAEAKVPEAAKPEPPAEAEPKAEPSATAEPSEAAKPEPPTEAKAKKADPAKSNK